MKKLLLVVLCLGGVGSTEELRVHFALKPADTKIRLVKPPPMPDEMLPVKDQICTLAFEGKPLQLRFSHDRYNELSLQLSREQVLALPEDPQNAGVRLYPALALKPQGNYAIAFFVSDNLFWLAPSLLVGGFLVVRRQQKARQASERLAKWERYSVAEGGDPMVGKRLDQYLLTQRLGSGGMAVVYRGIPYDTLDESEAVAIKIIQEAKRDEEFLQRFRREVHVTQSLNHPNTLRLFGWGEQDGLFFLIMELVAGQPLKPPAGGFSVAEFRALIPSLMAGLIYAHDRGIVHRDLKPDNLMLLPNGQIKVMDFGLARDHEMKTVTATGTALGTPAYMSPEQITGQPPSFLSDQYSLGVTFYELLCGRRPFEYDELMALIQAHLGEEPMPVSIYREDLPLELEQVVMQMMCKAPERRFRDLKAVQLALQEAFEGI